jgi:hypothetical protein
VPSHRADTPADAPTAVLTRSSAHPPLQRRRDLRARNASTPASAGRGALDWLEQAPRAAVPAQRDLPGSAGEWAAPWSTGAPATTGSLDAPTAGALALDPLFLGGSRADTGDGPPAPVQPLRRPRGKERAQAQSTRRALRTAPTPSAQPQAAPTGRRAALPQAGIAGALGLATIAVPLAGALGVVPGNRPETVPNTAAAAALTPLPPFPLVASPPLTALADRRLLPDETPEAQVPAALAAPRIRLTADGRASRSKVRPVLPGCDGKVPDVTRVQNGRLPASMLCTLWDPDHQLRSDAAVALAKLNVLYTKRFGHPICFNDAYRSLAEQYAIKARRGGYAARPGTSEHGWGLAVDLCDGVDEGPRSATYGWMRANAPAYGWENPTWARSGGSGPYEPWHWEYMPGEQGQGKGD